MRAVTRVEISGPVVATWIANIRCEVRRDRIAAHRLHPPGEVRVHRVRAADVETGVADADDLAGAVEARHTTQCAGIAFDHANGHIVADAIHRLASHHAHTVNLRQFDELTAAPSGSAARLLHNEYSGGGLVGRDAQAELP